MTIETLALKAVPAAFNALAKALTDLGSRNTNNMLEAMEIDRRSHHAQVAQQVKVLMVEWAKSAKDAEDLRAKVESMASDSQFHRLHANLEYEAVRSTLDDRKRMLAAAAAGLCDPTISIEYKARVERTLRELDPGDVQLLDQLRTFHLNSPSMHPTGIPIPRATYVDGAKHLVNSDPMARGVLLTTACIDTEETGLGPLYLVTQLGDLVLRVLKTYLRGKSDA